MTAEDIFINDLKTNGIPLNCVVYEDSNFFRHLYSGPFSGIPDNLRNREIENMCLQYNWQLLIYIKPESPVLRAFRKLIKFFIRR